MAEIETITSAEWEAKVAKAEGLVMVDFWAEWCGPCKMLTPIVEKLAGEFEGKLTVYKLDVSKEQELASRYGVMSIPALIWFKGGEVVEQVVGLRNEEELKKLIDKQLA